MPRLNAAYAGHKPGQMQSEDKNGGAIMEETRKTLTSEQWKTVEDLATSQFRMAKLIIDGYEIELHLEPTSKYKSVIMVYVDGKFEGKKVLEDCEERRRFYRPVIRNLLPAKPPKSWKKKEWET